MDQQRILDRYRLTERLALGGSAAVWRAQDERLDRAVAVKLLHPHLVPDERSRQRLTAEARAAAGLSHPGIVSVYDVDTAGEAPALVMELVEGESLAVRLAREAPLPPAEAVRIVAETAEALFHAHQRGIVHRDVKPGNILLEADGRARLVDFGISHSLAQGAARLTMTGSVMGTLRSMAPEQLDGSAVGPRTDLYGLGTVLYEALTGRPPYAAATPLGLIEEQRAGPPPMTGVDPQLAALTVACLSVDPTHRPLHAGALAEALRAWLSGETAPTLTSASVGGAAAVAAGEADTQALTRPVVPAPALPVRADGRRADGRRRGRIGAGLLAALVAAGALLAVVMLASDRPGGGSDSPSPSPTATQGAAVPGWAEKLAEDYAEQCGETLDPAALAALGKDRAERLVEPQIRRCEGGDGDD